LRPVGKNRRARPLHALFWALLGTGALVALLRAVFGFGEPAPVAIGVGAFVLSFLIFLYD